MSPTLHPVPDRPTVRVVHPSGAIGEHLPRLERGLARLERAGCRVRWDNRGARRAHRGYLAGDDSQRLDELVAAFQEPGVDVVWAARGGSGAARIARRLTERLRGLRPRLLVGFSDVTTLHAALNQHLDWPGIHGPVITTLGHDNPRTGAVAQLDEVLSVLTGARSVLRFPAQAGRRLTGPLYGGNLTVLASLAGLGLLPTPAGALWLLEDHAEPPYALDRALTQLRLGSNLARAAAVWVGDLGLAEPGPTLRHLAADLPCPLLHGAPAGHRGAISALPLGVEISLDPAAGRLAWSVERALV